MRLIQTVAAATMAVGMAAGASAQATMPKDSMAKTDSMAMAKTAPTSYTGCVEAGSTAGTFVLTHFSADMAMGKDAMAKDGMKKDTMAKDDMAKDSMKKDAMKDTMMKDGMMADHLILTGTAVNLAPHVGHKVMVTGKSGEKMAFTVATVKMVASSCQ